MKIRRMQFALGGPDLDIEGADFGFSKNDFIQNVFKANRMNARIWLKKYGQKIGANEWNVNALNTNAWYSAGKNKITLPAATLKQLFSLEAPKAINYGLLGITIAHEMGHAFEKQGIRYDHNGKQKNWLSGNDKKSFEKQCDSLAAIYQKLPIRGDDFTNGEKALIESIPDHLGLAVAFEAFTESLNGKETIIESFTPEQLFFITYAQKYRDVLSEECIKKYVAVYDHPLPKYRVNVPLSSMPGFVETFCKEQKNVDQNYFSIW